MLAKIFFKNRYYKGLVTAPLNEIIMNENRLPYIEILGVRFDLVNINEVLIILESWVNNSKNIKKYIVTPNPEFVVNAQRDSEYKQIINSSNLSITDGFGIKLAAKFLNLSVPIKIAGTDLMDIFCHKLSQLKIPVFFLGGRDNVSLQCAEYFKNKYPELIIAGCMDGDPRFQYDEEMVNKINKTDAKFIFVAYGGSAKQEKWINRNLSNLKNIKVAMGVGGAFDYWSGNISRAPLFMRNIGLEWLYRLIKQPKRIFRIFNAIIIFPILVIKDKLVNSKLKFLIT